MNKKNLLLLLKIVTLSLICVGIMGMVFCNNNAQKSELEYAQDTILRDEDFVIINENNHIELNGKWEDMLIGESLLSSQLICESQAYDVFIYENYILSVTPRINNESTIWCIA
ncbi:hypothetical protein LJC58_09130, partial [Lachnospiraceae bacterium OttesenSCG-928-D06]|nr:hypothetical protein [Lachnospiraceae bacterium OttesenSCG-928-D06]